MFADGRAVDMVSETTRNEVWQSLLDVARLIRYYDAYANRRRLYHFILRGLLLFAAAGGVANMLAVLPDFVLPAVSVAIAVLVVVDFACNYARQAAVLHAIGRECGKLEVEWKNLWANMNAGSVGDKKAMSINQDLARQLLEVTSWAGDADIREDRKLNEKCAEDAYKVMVEQYAG